jgi:toxin YoeB
LLRWTNELTRAIQRDPFQGIGKPEPLKHGLSGYWSRRIDDEHRIVYKIQDYKIQVYKIQDYKIQVYKIQVYKIQVYKIQDDALLIAQCRGHY